MISSWPFVDCPSKSRIEASSPQPSPDVVRILRAAAQEVRSLSIASRLTWLNRTLGFVTEARDRLALQLDIAETLVLLGRVGEAEVVCTELANQPFAAEDGVRLHLLLASIMVAGRTHSGRAVTHLERAVELLDGSERRVEVMGMLASILLFDGQSTKGHELITHALGLYPDGDRSLGARRLYEARCVAASLTGDPYQAVQFGRTALDIFNHDGESNAGTDAISWTVLPHFSLALAMLQTSNIRDVLAVLREGRAACDRAGHILAGLNLESLVSIAHFVAGDLDVAHRAVSVNIELGTHLGTGGIAMPTETALGAYLAVLNDDMATAASLGERALGEILEDGGQAGGGDFVALMIAWVRESLGDVDGAREILKGVWELFARDAGLPTITPDLVRLSCHTERQLAIEVTERIEARAQRSNAPVDKANALACRGLLDGRPENLEEAALVWEKLGWVLQPTRVREYALDLLTNRSPEEVRAHINRVAAAWEQMGAVRPARLLEIRANALGARRPNAKRATNGPASLTKTESVVVQLVADGLTNRDIARRLYVSHRTVDSHVSHALAKLGVTTRVQLARFAHDGPVPAGR